MVVVEGGEVGMRAGCTREQDADRGTHLGQAGGEEHTLKELPHPLEELVHVRPLQHVHLRWEETRAVSHGSQRQPGPWESCQGALLLLPGLCAVY